MTRPRLHPQEVAANASTDTSWQLGYSAGLREVRSSLALKGIILGAGAWLFTRPGGLVWKCAAVALLFWLVLVAIHFWVITVCVLGAILTLVVLRHGRVHHALHAQLPRF
jgi:hypothetical protein